MTGGERQAVLRRAERRRCGDHRAGHRRHFEDGGVNSSSVRAISRFAGCMRPLDFDGDNT